MTDSERKVVEETLEGIRQKIAENIATKKRLDGRGVINTTGRTVKSMHVEMREDGGRLLGREHFEELETGIPPRMQPANFSDIIYQWSIDKGLRFEDGHDERAHFAYLTARKILTEGSTLYRMGGRSDIFTDVIFTATDDLKAKIKKAEVRTIETSIFAL